MKGLRSLRANYRDLVSLLIIPLGCIIVVRTALFGVQAWSLLIMGFAFIVLGIVRLRNARWQERMQGVFSNHRKRA